MTTTAMPNMASDEAMYIFPTSFGQQRLWLLHQLDPTSTAYNMAFPVRISTPLRIEALEQSLAALVQRHEILRTTFVARDGQPMQLIAPQLRVPLAVVDLQPLPQAEREPEALRLANQQAQRPFDLARGPLLRLALFQLGPQEFLLLLLVHHIIFDAPSAGLFFQELARLYQALSVGQAPAVPDLPLQYADFAAWQRSWMQGEALAEQLGYWKQQLAGAPAVLDLPTDRPRASLSSGRGATYPFKLPRQLSEALKTLSRQEGVSLFMTLVAAFQVLLHRYSGQEDLLLGTFTADRSQPETRDLLGFFVNTLVLRGDLSGNPPFRELLRRLREVMLEAYAHQDAPFEALVQALRPERSPGQNPLFQVLLTLDPPEPSLPAGWSYPPMLVQTGAAQFELVLEIIDHPAGLEGGLEYVTDLFDEATVARMVDQWQTLLEGIVADPSQPIAGLPLLTEQGRHQLLIEWNATQSEYPRDKCVHQLFEEQVERSPDAIAIAFLDQKLTYRELNRKANQLAHYLRQLGVDPEVLVGICVERSLEMVIGLFAILKAGGAYVPLDPGFPAERLAFMLQDAQVPVLLTQQQLTSQLPAHQAKVVCLDADAALLNQENDANPAPVPSSSPESLAYVIYTSGSTGRPKGVQIVHRAVVNFLLSMRQQPGLTAQDRLLAITTLSFDIAALELFLPLLVGARLVVADHETVTSGSALAEALARSEATVMQATPVTWRMLLEAGWQGNQHIKLLCGGEALPLELAQQLLPRGASLWNLYGPTETTIWSTVCQVEPHAEVVSIGRPIANTQIYILDAQLQPVPIGVAGELYIGGDGLARGYLNRPELTAERFIQHPFSQEPGARLYKTGDLARYRSDGTIEHLGRLDYQVKLRGFRIELGEIEALLSQHPAVQQAVVVAREDVPGNKRLVAYMVLREGQLTTSAELHKHTAQQLPGYMLPSSFVLLGAFPLTPNGKVDRKALPAPDPTSYSTKETYVAPTLMVHYQLKQIWEELLDARPIGIRDNFFHLGGHSLLAALLIARIEQVFKKKISLATLFARPTIEELATALHEGEDRGSRKPILPVQAAGFRPPFFFLHGDWDGEPFYCFTLARDLGSDQPFYILEPYRLDGLQVPPTFEAMAAAHIESIRAIQPEGPYFLGGWCSGALVAYEIARQLQQEGQRVDLLVLMDPFFITARHKVARAIISRVGTLVRLGQEKQLDWFLRVQHIYRYLRFLRFLRLKDAEHLQTAEQGDSGQRGEELGLALLGLKSTIPTEPISIIPTVEVLRRDNGDIFDWIVTGYAAGLYPGKITIFWDSEDVARRAKWLKGPEAKEVEVHIIPGSHITARTKYIHDLAEQLRICLSKAQTTALST